MMGSACCCFGVPDNGGLADENGSNHGSGSCFSCCFQSLVNMQYQALFQRGSLASSVNQEAVPSDSEVAHNLPTDQNSRSLVLPANGVVRGQDRGSSHSRVEPEPFSEAEVQLVPKLMKMEDKLVNGSKQGESGDCCSESSLKILSSRVKTAVDYVVLSSEDEDVCPTCLEEYTEENPKILTHCSHHYHLSCIYEWMERSDTCPVCGKLMEFVE